VREEHPPTTKKKKEKRNEKGNRKAPVLLEMESNKQCAYLDVNIKIEAARI
jgi:hypothetical protein